MRAVLAAAVLLAAPAAFAETPSPGVDWSTRVIRVKGSGAPDTQKSANVAVARINAERAAKLDAYRAALEQLKGVQVSSGSAAGALLDDATTRASVEAVIRGARIVDTKYFEDGGVDVYLEVPLDGAIGDALVKPAAARAVPAAGKAQYTGLVVDASGLSVTPALAPRLVDDKGGEVFGAGHVKAEKRTEHGPAGYRKGVEAAKKDARAGSLPLVIKAVMAAGSDLVISGADAAKLRDPKGNLAFLADGNVVIAID
jgi:hypothetical protein